MEELKGLQVRRKKRKRKQEKLRERAKGKICRKDQLKSHRIPNWLMLAGTSEDHLVWSPCSGRATQTEQAALDKMAFGYFQGLAVQPVFSPPQCLLIHPILNSLSMRILWETVLSPHLSGQSFHHKRLGNWLSMTFSWWIHADCSCWFSCSSCVWKSFPRLATPATFFLYMNYQFHP